MKYNLVCKLNQMLDILLFLLCKYHFLIIAPHGDYEPDAPEAIERMMKNGIKFACSIQSWKVERESVRVKKSFPVYFKLDTQVPVAQIVDALDAKGLIRNISFLFSVG